MAERWRSGPVLCWKRMTRNGALAGMIIGAATVLIWKQYAWLNLYEIIPGFLFASIAIVVVSLAGREPSAEAQQRFDAAEAEYNTK